MAARNRAAQAGNSLVEVMVVCVLMVVVLAGIGAAVGVVSSSSHEVASQSRLTTRLGLTMERLAAFARRASDASVRMTTGGGMAAATDASSLAWVAPVTSTHYDGVQSRNGSIVFVLDPGETDNGKDDDNDGLVDEGSLYSTTTDTKPVAIAGNVELFDVEWLDRAIQVRLVLAAVDSEKDSQIRRMRVVQTFELRN